MYGTAFCFYSNISYLHLQTCERTVDASIKYHFEYRHQTVLCGILEVFEELVLET
jgi:hypothetical protein